MENKKIAEKSDNNNLQWINFPLHFKYKCCLEGELDDK